MRILRSCKSGNGELVQYERGLERQTVRYQERKLVVGRVKVPLSSSQTGNIIAHSKKTGQVVRDMCYISIDTEYLKILPYVLQILSF